MSFTVDDFLSSHPYTTETKATYRPVLLELAAEDIQNWSAADLLDFITRPGWGNSRQYVNLCACRKFIAWLFGVEHPALSARIKRVKAKKQRSLSIPQVIDLLASFDPFTPIGARDLALAAIALDTGLRASELARIQLPEVNLQRRTLQVIIKGGQWGMAIFSPETALILDRWLSFRSKTAKTAALFVSLRKSATGGGQLTVSGVKAIFKKWSFSQGYKLSPHDMRRSFATLSTILGAPSRVVQSAGRWSSIDMVERYTQDIHADAITPYLPVTHTYQPKS